MDNGLTMSSATSVDSVPNSDAVVLYIGGVGRSGSTVLSALLGTCPGFVPVGELRGVWQAVRTDELCGCGLPFSVCDFWRRVGEKAFGGWRHVDAEKMIRLDAAYARHRTLPNLLMARLWRGTKSDLGYLTSSLHDLYQAIRMVSECSVIVDSTKTPPYAFLLRGIPGLDVRVIHLVRDSRGVAHSWHKEDVARPEYANHPTLSASVMDRHGQLRSAMEWDLKSALFELLTRFGGPVALLRYEELMRKPNLAVASTLSRLGLSSSTPAVRAGEFGDLLRYESLPHHTLGGNRVRFKRGLIPLRADNEWQAVMPKSERVIVGCLTLPFLIKYGYLRPRLGSAYTAAPGD